MKRGGAALVRALRRPTGQVRVDADTLRAGWRQSWGSAPPATGAAAASRASTLATAVGPDRGTAAAPPQ
ncbi:MAG: hypothetical protein M3N52_01215, partial [Actinomycetota bacterium]|nr:hypothetical protein [Actinomycetota bacterium]